MTSSTAVHRCRAVLHEQGSNARFAQLTAKHIGRFLFLPTHVIPYVRYRLYGLMGLLKGIQAMTEHLILARGKFKIRDISLGYDYPSGINTQNPRPMRHHKQQNIQRKYSYKLKKQPQNGLIQTRKTVQARLSSQDPRACKIKN